MADLDNATKVKLERLLEMGGGYVLDFTNATFSDFVRTAVGFDPYERYGGASKANVLRALWQGEPIEVIAKLNRDMLEHWRLRHLLNDTEPTGAQQTLYDELLAQFAVRVVPLDAATTDFLARDFGTVDLSALPTSLTAKDVVDARFKEIETCLQAGAPLAVIFLVGSTLEGLLTQFAKANAASFVRALAAPKDRGTVRPLDRWTLSNLIDVARELTVLSADVAKHADQVRNFRNYIHPRQQLAEGFEPRAETARIAQQVLRAAVVDLERVAKFGDAPNAG